MADLHKTPNANRLHIAIFGKRNTGKSTLINALTNQNLAIVSNHAGTTTDPVYKAMEIYPIGPVVMIDTAGIDDSGELGELRIQKSLQVINKTDIALIVIDSNGITDFDKKIINLLEKKNTDFLIIINKIDEEKPSQKLLDEIKEKKYNHIAISSLKKEGILELKELIIKYSPKYFEQPSIMGDLINPGDTVVLVIPIDSGMPKGRLILPEVQTMRDILDHNAMFYTTKETELKQTLENLKEKPKLVITDSQAFEEVAKITPEEIPLTSFSILFARYKGDLSKLVNGARALKNLKSGDKILISEACTHHRQCDDIGTVKMPKWINQHINGEIDFDFCSGRDYPDNLTDYKLVVHCAGCMLNRKEMLSRIEASVTKGVPIINYGVTIAYIHGILDRALKPFTDVYKEWISE